MPQLPRRRLIALLALFLYALAALTSAYFAFVLDDASVYDENGPLENAQAVLLMLACLGFAVQVRHAAPLDKPVFFACALLAFAFVVNELDIERFDVPEVVKVLGAGTGRVLVLGLGVAVAATWSTWHGMRSLSAVFAFLHSPGGVLMAVAGVMLVIGRLFEKNIPVMHNALWEELFELAGYVLMLLAAWRRVPEREAGSP